MTNKLDAKDYLRLLKHVLNHDEADLNVFDLTMTEIFELGYAAGEINMYREAIAVKYALFRDTVINNKSDKNIDKSEGV